MALMALNDKVVEEINLIQTSSVQSKKDNTIVQRVGTKNVAKSRKKSLHELFPAFGLLMCIISVFCLSITALIVKLLNELHSIELLAFRYCSTLYCYT